MNRVRIAINEDQTRWNDFVLSQENAGPYHLFALKLAIEKAYHHKTFYLICENEKGETNGVLPLILVKPPFMPATLVSLPFCDYGGALTTQEEVEKELLEYAFELTRSINAHIEIRNTHPKTLLSSLHQLGAISHKARMVLDLPENSETLWNSFKSKLRSQIKKPQKDGLEFILGATELVNDFYKVFSANMRDLGSPVHSKAWIEAVVRFYGTRAHVGVVYAGAKPVAGGIILEGKGVMCIPWASALNEYNRSSPNMLLYWGLLAYTCDHGFNQFDFGRSTPGEGSYRFKEQWGAGPFPLYWYKRGSRAGIKVGISVDRLREHIAEIWAKIPIPIVNYIGPVIRKYITL